jgi:hypothetical protein
MSTNTVTMTAAEAEVLLEAAKFAKTRLWSAESVESEALARAIQKLRHADVILIEQDDDTDTEETKE